MIILDLFLKDDNDMISENQSLTRLCKNGRDRPSYNGGFRTCNPVQ